MSVDWVKLEPPQHLKPWELCVQSAISQILTKQTPLYVYSYPLSSWEILTFPPKTSVLNPFKAKPLFLFCFFFFFCSLTTRSGFLFLCYVLLFSYSNQTTLACICVHLVINQKCVSREILWGNQICSPDHLNPSVSGWRGRHELERREIE